MLIEDSIVSRSARKSIQKGATKLVRDHDAAFTFSAAACSAACSSSMAFLFRAMVLLLYLIESMCRIRPTSAVSIGGASSGGSADLLASSLSLPSMTCLLYWMLFLRTAAPKRPSIGTSSSSFSSASTFGDREPGGPEEEPHRPITNRLRGGCYRWGVCVWMMQHSGYTWPVLSGRVLASVMQVHAGVERARRPRYCNEITTSPLIGWRCGPQNSFRLRVALDPRMDPP